MLQGVPKSLYTLLIIINNVFIIFYLNLIEIVKKMWKNWRAVSIVLSLPFLNFMSVLVEILLTGQSSGVAHIIKQFPRSLLTFTFSNPPPPSCLVNLEGVVQHFFIPIQPCSCCLGSKRVSPRADLTSLCKI